MTTHKDITDGELAEILGESTPKAPLAKETSISGLRTFISQEELRKDISFKDTDVSVAFMNQASLFVHYAQKAHQARLQADSAKHRIDILESRLDKLVRAEAVRNGVKMTEGAIAAEIKIHDDHIKAVEFYNEAKMVADLCKDVTEAFRHRRDMLIQFGADARQERQGDLRMGSETPSERAARIAKNVKNESA